MDRSTILSIIAYLPFVGWFFPMFFTDTHDTTAQFHAKQGVIVSAALLASVLAYILLTMMMPKPINFLLTVALIGVFGFALYHSGIAVRNILTGRGKYSIPLIDRIFDKINI